MSKSSTTKMDNTINYEGEITMYNQEHNFPNYPKLKLGRKLPTRLERAIILDFRKPS